MDKTKWYNRLGIVFFTCLTIISIGITLFIYISDAVDRLPKEYNYSFQSSSYPYAKGIEEVCLSYHYCGDINGPVDFLNRIEKAFSRNSDNDSKLKELRKDSVQETAIAFTFFQKFRNSDGRIGIFVKEHTIVRFTDALIISGISLGIVIGWSLVFFILYRTVRYVVTGRKIIEFN